MAKMDAIEIFKLVYEPVARFVEQLGGCANRTIPDLNLYPASLYHYTSVRSFVGICRSASIYASDSRFLNDTSEMKHGLDLARKMLKEKRGELISNAPEHLRSEFEVFCNQLIDQLHRNHSAKYAAYVTSFCHDANQLVQWRSYCHDGGLCFGISTKRLRRTLNPRHRLHRCQYEPDKQKEILESVIQALPHNFSTLEGIIDYVRRDKYLAVAVELVLLFATYALLFKDKQFEQEREYRIIVTAASMIDLLYDNYETPLTQHRCVGERIVPYIALDLPLYESTMPLRVKKLADVERVIAAPHHPDPMIMDSLNAMLGWLIPPNCVLEQSEISYRS